MGNIYTHEVVFQVGESDVTKFSEYVLLHVHNGSGERLRGFLGVTIYAAIVALSQLKRIYFQQVQ